MGKSLSRKMQICFYAGWFIWSAQHFWMAWVDPDARDIRLLAGVVSTILGLLFIFSFHARVFLSQFVHLDSHDEKLSDADLRRLREREEHQHRHQRASVAACSGCGHDLSETVRSGKEKCPACGQAMDWFQVNALRHRDRDYRRPE